MTLPDPAMKRRIRPIGNATAMPVLDRVEMDVIEVRSKIVVVANPMLPEAALPDAALAPALPT